MSLSNVWEKWKQVIEIANNRGLPLPMVRDPDTLEGSVSLTLVVMSSFLVVVGIIGKWSGWFGGIDMNSAFNFFYASTTLYFGHSWVHKDPKPVEEPKGDKKVDDPDDQDDPTASPL